jgi:two-component system, NtrC family, response regulator AtoC
MAPRRPRILIVDNERNARSALAEILCDAGYEVALAANGREALALVDSFHPDVLLADAQLPGLSGYALAELARTRVHAPRVVFMSGAPPEAPRDVPCLAKPLRIDELLQTLALQPAV